MTETEAMTHKNEFAERGFTVRRGLLSADEVAATIRAIDRARPRDAVPSELDKGGLKFKHNIHQGSPELQAFVSQIRDELLVAQVLIERADHGYQLHHIEDRDRGAFSLRALRLTDLRALA